MYVSLSSTNTWNYPKQAMGTIVQVLYHKDPNFSKTNSTQVFTNLFLSKSYSRSLNHVRDLKPSYENPRYLAHSSKHKTLVHQEAL
jgi:hypothetical protein